jgi:hypothetical protein
MCSNQPVGIPHILAEYLFYRNHLIASCIGKPVFCLQSVFKKPVLKKYFLPKMGIDWLYCISDPKDMSITQLFQCELTIGALH